MPIAKPKVLSIRFLSFVKVSMATNLDRAEAEDVTGDIVADIMLYNFICFVLDINVLDWDLQHKNKNKPTVLIQQKRRFRY